MLFLGAAKIQEIKNSLTQVPFHSMLSHTANDTSIVQLQAGVDASSAPCHLVSAIYCVSIFNLIR
jgi:hypothetical protein